MQQSDISAWLQFALQQIAAESYLDGILLSNGNDIITRLKLGNNNPLLNDPNDPTLDGATRFIDLAGEPNASKISGSAQAFVARYQIVDHHANDATGFSATLMRERDQNGNLTNNFTLSFRSVEYQNEVEGGDWERDGLPGAAGEIAGTGFALAQLVSMEKYYEQLKASGTLPAGVTLNVTGYSLGGHLATVFTELHTNEINATYTFNGAGRGRINVGTADLSDADRIREMLQFAEPRLEAIDPSWFVSGNRGNVYEDQQYQAARQDTFRSFSTTNSFLPPGEVGTGPGFEKITQLVGQATHNDQHYVTNSGIHGKPTTIFIEDQPNVDGLAGLFGQSGSFGTTHSITLLVDSLALMELFQTVDGTLDQATIEGILGGASSQAASGFVGLSGVAEGNSLENALDALGKIFVPGYTPMPFGRQTNDYGILTFRNQFYTNINQVKRLVASDLFTIDSLVNVPSSKIFSEARNNSSDGMAYRYALQELIAFAVRGVDYGALHNQGPADNGPLDLYNAQTGQGTWTLNALSDRAELLTEKLKFTQADGAPNNASPTLYLDQAADFNNGRNATATEVVMFGDAEAREFLGRSGNDHIYGGAGNDVISGFGGQDYLEGGTDHDTLDGGSENDILLGQQGMDTLMGGAGNDQLDGGLDTDRLEGGQGTDTYFYHSGQGNDVIADADRLGVVRFDNQVLQGALHRTGDPANTYVSSDGSFTYVRAGTNLVINNTLIVENFDFARGALSIHLASEVEYESATRTVFEKVDHYQQVGNNQDGTPIYDPVYAPFFDELSNDTRNTSAIGGLVPAIDDLSNLIYAGGGGDFILSGSGDDQIYGEGDDDEIYGGLGNDRLFGGGGNDRLLGDNAAVSTDGGNDYLDGGDGSDFVQGGAGRDIVLGGAGNDLLNGDEFAGDNSGVYDDWLDGGGGDDDLQGGAGSDVLIGGADNDFLVGDRTQFQSGTPDAGGNDSLDGGAGNDQLFGVYGDDVLSGGTGHDLVNGQDGSDVLYGGDGNDTLSGDLRLTSLTGGYDTREWRAAGGDDLLFGEVGADLLSGGEGNDVIDGGSEDDKLYGDYITSQISTSDPLYWTLFSAPGDDWLTGGAGNDALSGGFGADVLMAGEGFDSLLGGAGDDVLDGGAGDDVLYGEYSFAAPEFLFNPFFSTIKALSGNDVLDGGDGSDELHGGEGSDVLLGGVGNDHLIDDESGYSVAGGTDVLNGGDGDDVLESWIGDDELHGGAGNDRLTSHAGHDMLYGDDGDDFLSSGEEPPFSEGVGPISATGDSTLIGGLGNDAYEIDGPGDVVVEAMGEGTDTVNSFVSYTLPDDVENLNLAGLALTGVGNNLNNVLTGGNWLEGLEGDDTLIGRGRLDGGTGNDVLQGGTGSVVFSPEDGLLHVVANTYVFGADYGQDTIQENDPTFNSAYYSNEDTLFFTSGISPSDVVWERSGQDLLLTVNGGPDRITIPSFYNLHVDRGGYLVNGLTAPPQGIVSTSNGGFPTYVAPSRVELVQFGDGTVWHADHFGAPTPWRFSCGHLRFRTVVRRVDDYRL